MKKVYENKGYKVYSHKILDYLVKVHETTSSGCLVSVPMGNNKKDKKMFDSLVYYNKYTYWGTTKLEAVKKVREWIKRYKARG